jgi:hypothetical protein
VARGQGLTDTGLGQEAFKCVQRRQGLMESHRDDLD